MTMENHHPGHKVNTSGDNFTFPAMSPDIQMESELADHLFSNGKFLLHTFPLQPKGFTTCTTFSRTSSVSSKDSLVSSRSNSTNSRSSSSGSSSSSSCNSARTSISDASNMKTKEKGSQSPVHYCNNNSYYYYSPAQRWQFMAPVPVLNRRTSQRRKGEEGKRNGSSEKKKCNRRKGYCRRILEWLVSTCRECHAMKPSKKEF